MSDKKITLLFIFLACFAGFFSNHFKNFLRFALPTILYIFPILTLSFCLKLKNKKKIFIDSLVTYILVWILVWTLLYNLT
jgi:hypothetical protein